MIFILDFKRFTAFTVYYIYSDSLWYDNSLYVYFFLDPFFLPKEQVDLGAIKFVMSGANIMCPGLTSPGAKIEPVPQNTIVVSF